MRIGELAKRTSISRDAIRFYERSGLIASRPEKSPSNNYRVYSEDTVLTIELIREAQAAGFTLSELRQFIFELQGASDADFDGVAFLDRKIRDVEETLSRSQRFLTTLRQTRDALLSAANGS